MKYIWIFSDFIQIFLTEKCLIISGGKIFNFSDCFQILLIYESIYLILKIIWNCVNTVGPIFMVKVSIFLFLLQRFGKCIVHLVRPLCPSLNAQNVSVARFKIGRYGNWARTVSPVTKVIVLIDYVWSPDSAGAIFLKRFDSPTLPPCF